MAKIHRLVCDKIIRDNEAMSRQIGETDNRDRKERIRLVYYANAFRALRNADLL